jgi:hypothetical protein
MYDASFLIFKSNKFLKNIYSQKIDDSKRKILKEKLKNISG